MRSTRSLVSTSIALVVAAAPALALASPTYPGDIKSDLGLSYDLGVSHCTICHATNAGGVGTVVQPFGIAMKMAGLTLEAPDKLQAALMTLDMEKTDSDCDGTPDIEQLKAGRDPNPPGEYIDGSGRTAPADPGCMNDTGPTPAYGCGARLAPGPAGASGAGLLFGALAIASARRRLARRRRARSRSGRAAVRSCLSGR